MDWLALVVSLFSFQDWPGLVIRYNVPNADKGLYAGRSKMI